jgi:cation diffusion facilitator CzcD-associated flavoprotein CzcO
LHHIHHKEREPDITLVTMGSITEPSLDYEVIIIGAGFSGIYSLIKMRELGARVKVIEAGSQVGGTWYWNRYPGAQFDSESVSYGFSFSKDLLDEWKWEESFSPQPETEKYANFVCDKFDLRRDIQLDTRIAAAQFHTSSRSWQLTSEVGETFTSRYLITAMGPLTQATLPNVPGVHEYKGQAFHTSRWPDESPDLSNKRVAVIGTGATGIQTIQTIARDVGHLAVFQRQPNWSKPLHNTKISDEEMAKIRLRYPEIFQRCKETSNAFIHGNGDTRRTVEVPKEEREALWEKLYAEPGLGIVLSNFQDIHKDKEANGLLSEFIANKIRSRVHDPVIAEKLIPRNHGVGTKRLPLETHYFEVYNQPNVELVDLRDTPLECITEKGIRTTEKEREFDIIIYATGFDAFTGAFDAINFIGVNGTKLRDMWKEGPRTYLGITVQDFPNMFMIMGPHQAMGNIPRSIEYAVAWVSSLITFCRERGITWVEPTPELTEEWYEHVNNCAVGLLANDVDSWMTGVNKNVATRQKRIVMRYQGGILVFRKYCDRVAASKYAGMKLL